MSEPKTDAPLPRMTLIVLFVVSAVTLGLEILLTRVFSVVLFSSHTFMAISLTLLGTGSGAILAYLGKALSPDALKKRQVMVMALMAFVIVISFWTVLQVEFVPQEIENPRTGEIQKDLTYGQLSRLFSAQPELFDSWKLYAIIPLVFLPFLLAGYLQAIIFRTAPARFGMLYGVDLIGATFGSIFIPLLLYPLGLLGTITTVALLTLIPVVYHLMTVERSKPLMAAAVAPLVLMLILTISGSYRVKYSAGFKEKDVKRDKWSPMARVALTDYHGRPMYVIDSGSRTFFVNKQDRYVNLYRMSMYTIAFQMKTGGELMVIASGGGQELVMGDHYKMKHIDAVEIAGPLVRDIVNKEKDTPGNPYLLPAVTYHIADGRSVAMRTKRSYDVIEMLEVNFHTLAGQISQAWSPYFVFTQEAFAEYMDKLKDDGYLLYTIFSGGMNPVAGNKGRRFRSVVAGMKLAGIENPEKHIVILARPYVYGNRTMVWAKKTPFTKSELVKIRKLAADRKVNIEVLYPDLNKIAGDVDFNLPEGEQVQKTKKYVSRTRSLIRKTEPIRGMLGTYRSLGTNKMSLPINDDRPYLVGSGFSKTPAAKEAIIGDLYKKVLKTLGVLAFIFVVMPFVIRRPGGGEKMRIDIRLLLILTLTGVGFMFVEMAGIYRYQLYLHHPVLALIIVLSSMVLGAGLGSLHSSRIKDEKKQWGVVFYSLLASVLAVLLFIVQPMVGHKLLLVLPLPLVMALCFIAFCATGFVLGHVVPLSIASYARNQGAILAWAWAITVTGSVAGTVFASITAREWGMFPIAILGMVAYGVISLIALIGIGVTKVFKGSAQNEG
jgi:hypothetical protein